MKSVTVFLAEPVFVPPIATVEMPRFRELSRPVQTLRDKRKRWKPG